ncbi:MAG: hypothetical protein OXI66_17375, partial [Boseongicola sp.]|nr:hypothetical protein [Boseongicola sp.]
MQACGVAGALDEVRRIGCDVLEGFAVADAGPLDSLGLQDAFGSGIVMGIAAPARGKAASMRPPATETRHEGAARLEGSLNKSGNRLCEIKLLQERHLAVLSSIIAIARPSALSMPRLLSDLLVR